MIRKIQRIKLFGVFADFRWPTDLPVFNRYNLIYGWNYSGKTTLSRVLRCFELNQIHPDFSTAEVRLEVEGGAVHDLASAANAPAIRVFNTDFIRDNLFLDDGQHAHPILILGQQDIEKQRRLDALKKEREKVAKERDESERKRTAVQAGLEKALSDKARDVKKTLSLPDYEKRHFRPKVSDCAKSTGENVLDDKEFTRELKAYSSKEKKPPIAEILFKGVSPTSLRDKITLLLEKTASAIR